ncbi:MAG: hypothetical protein NT154_01495, partial [Verrucomicrobia bacterium]|nr:hypothetical protein [Verrucomicrobiota bacterium]
QVLITQRIGTNGSPITLNQYQYDVLGRILRETNALNGVTTHTNVLVNSQICVTNVNPDGGTRVEVYYRDGRLQSVSGTAVSPVQYQYGAEQDGSVWREFTLQSKVDANGGTNEWTKTYVDGAGQQYKTVYAGAGSNPVSLTAYNSGGHVTNQVDPVGVSMVYAYNGKGEQVLSVVNSNRNSTIDYEGGYADRITFTTNDVTSAHGSNVRRTQVYVWSTSSNSSNLISTVEASTDGLKNWSTLWNSGSAVTRQSSTVYSSNGNRYVTNTAPDNSYTVSLYQYGLLASVTSYDANNSQIGKTSYGYDNHFRQNTVTDARTGTTTYSFNDADQVSSVTTPSPTGVTTYYLPRASCTATPRPGGWQSAFGRAAPTPSIRTTARETSPGSPTALALQTSRMAMTAVVGRPASPRAALLPPGLTTMRGTCWPKLTVVAPLTAWPSRTPSTRSCAAALWR